MSSLTPIGTPFIELPTVDSTNNYAMGLVHEGMAQHGTAVFTHHQTRGKGQRNKQWQSLPGQNIALSLILQPKDLSTSDLFLLSMAVSNAVRSFFNKYAGEGVTIKWPNDLYWRDRKAGGILIENVLKGTDWKYAIVGIGLNINQTSFEGLDQKAVSLKQITGRSYGLLPLAHELCHSVNEQYNQMLKAPDAVREEYHLGLYKLNEMVKLKSGSRIFYARIKEVLPDGRLLVQHAVEETFSVGEVEWVSGE